jgi:hypothetical protein
VTLPALALFGELGDQFVELGYNPILHVARLSNCAGVWRLDWLAKQHPSLLHIVSHTGQEQRAVSATDILAMIGDLGHRTGTWLARRHIAIFNRPRHIRRANRRQIIE